MTLKFVDSVPKAEWERKKRENSKLLALIREFEKSPSKIAMVCVAGDEDYAYPYSLYNSLHRAARYNMPSVHVRISRGQVYLVKD